MAFWEDWVPFLVEDHLHRPSKCLPEGKFIYIYIDNNCYTLFFHFGSLAISARMQQQDGNGGQQMAGGGGYGGGMQQQGNGGGQQMGPQGPYW